MKRITTFPPHASYPQSVSLSNMDSTDLLLSSASQLPLPSSPPSSCPSSPIISTTHVTEAPLSPTIGGQNSSQKIERLKEVQDKGEPISEKFTTTAKFQHQNQRRIESLTLDLASDCIASLANLLLENKTKGTYLYTKIQASEFLQNVSKRAQENETKSEFANHFLVVAYNGLISSIEPNKLEIGEEKTAIYITQFKQMFIEIILLCVQIDSQPPPKKILLNLVIISIISKYG